jgi:hypothetical protein
MNPEASRIPTGPETLLGKKPQTLLEPSPESAAEAGVDPERRQARHENPGTESGVGFVQKTHDICATLSLLIVRGV